MMKARLIGGEYDGTVVDCPAQAPDFLPDRILVPKINCNATYEELQMDEHTIFIVFNYVRDKTVAVYPNSILQYHYFGRNDE